jgi:hypothetical protein
MRNHGYHCVAVPRSDLGSPANWADCPIWKEVGHAG